MITAATEGIPRVLVLSSRPLRGAAVSRVLARTPRRCAPTDDARGADVLLLVDPGPDDWEKARATDRPAVVLVDHEPSEGELLELVEAGACGVLPKDCEIDALFDALERVAGDDTAFARRHVRALANALARRARLASRAPVVLTKREDEILSAISAGLSVKQTAQRLCISPRTVENTQRMLYRKLGVRNRSQAVARGLETGLLDAPSDARPS